MKPATTLKELLKPPFEREKCSPVQDGSGYYIADIYTLKKLQEYENGKQLQGEFEKFVVHALNEKWERDFGNPLRWILDSDYADHESFTCPYCRTEYCFNERPDWENYSYCPACGKRVSPPEEKRDE